jgi:hypothetical protein
VYVPDSAPPQALPDGYGVTVYGLDCGELAGALRLLADILANRMPPASSRQARFTKRLETARAAFELAAQQQQSARHREHAARIRAVADLPAPVLSASAQVEGSSAPATITTRQAADLLNLTEQHVRYLASTGRIPGQQTARRVWELDRAATVAYGRRQRKARRHGSERAGTKP